MRRRKAIKHSKSFWVNHLETWRDSDLSQASACHRNNIKLKAFVYHKIRKFGSDKAHKPPIRALTWLPHNKVNAEACAGYAVCD
jgi:hypothetical protein